MSKLSGSSHEEIFLLNRLNLLIFNIIFTSRLGRVLGSSSLWEFILVRLQAFGLPFYWEWAPMRVFLSLCCTVQNYLFCRTHLGCCFRLPLLSGSIFLVTKLPKEHVIRLILKWLSYCEMFCYCIIVLVN